MSMCLVCSPRWALTARPRRPAARHPSAHRFRSRCGTLEEEPSVRVGSAQALLLLLGRVPCLASDVCKLRVPAAIDTSCLRSCDSVMQRHSVAVVSPRESSVLNSFDGLLVEVFLRSLGGPFPVEVRLQKEVFVTAIRAENLFETVHADGGVHGRDFASLFADADFIRFGLTSDEIRWLPSGMVLPSPLPRPSRPEGVTTVRYTSSPKQVHRHFHPHSFIQKGFHPKSVSSKKGFIPNRFHPKTVSSKIGFIQKQSLPKSVSSNNGFTQHFLQIGPPSPGPLAGTPPHWNPSSPRPPSSGPP